MRSENTINKELVARRFTKAGENYEKQASIQKQVALHMVALLQPYLADNKLLRVAEFGCGTGYYTRRLLQHLHLSHYWLNDLCTEMQTCLGDVLARPEFRFVAGDVEQLELPENCDLITSCSALQWMQQPERLLQRCMQHLRPDGYLAVSTYGEQNMKEITRVTGVGLPYRSLSELQQAVQPYGTVLVSQEEQLIASFSTPMHVLMHLKQTGVTGIQQQRWTKTKLTEFCQAYAHEFGNPQGVTLTYHPIYLLIQKM